MNTVKTVGLMTFLVVLFVAIGGALGRQRRHGHGHHVRHDHERRDVLVQR